MKTKQWLWQTSRFNQTNHRNHAALITVIACSVIDYRVWILILTKESFVGLCISQWDNGINEVWRVWLPPFVSVLFDPLGEAGYYSIDRVKS